MQFLVNAPITIFFYNQVLSLLKKTDDIENKNKKKYYVCVRARSCCHALIRNYDFTILIF